MSPQKSGTCTIEFCEKPAFARNWCTAHWSRWQRNGDPLATRRGTYLERFEASIDRTDAGCWVWNKTVAENGYGRFHVGNRYVLAHRWAYEMFVRPLPPDLVVDHLCRTRACVNPKHLDVVTHRENVMRGMSPSAIIRRQEVCKHGHPMTEENTYVSPRKPQHQQCRTCRKRNRRTADAGKVAANA